MILNHQNEVEYFFLQDFNPDDFEYADKSQIEMLSSSHVPYILSRLNKSVSTESGPEDGMSWV